MLIILVEARGVCRRRGASLEECRNSPPDCFSVAEFYSAPIPGSTPLHKKRLALMGKSFFGGGEGSRTPVRKSIHTAFYECSLSLGFPSRIPTNRRCGSVFSSTLGQPRNSIKALSTNRRPFSSRGTLERNGRYIKRRLLN